jgi:hypothetical protein
VSSVNVSSASRSENESSTGEVVVECNWEEWGQVGEMSSAGEDGGDSEGTEDGDDAT